MINYIEELDRLASQGEGGGDPPYTMVKRGDKYVAIVDGKEIAESTDQNAVIQAAQKYIKNPPLNMMSDRTPSPFAPTAIQSDVPNDVFYNEPQLPQNRYEVDSQLRPTQPSPPGEFDVVRMQTRTPDLSSLQGNTDYGKAVLQGAASQSGGAGSVVTGGQGVDTTSKSEPGKEERVPRQRGGGSWSAPGETEAFTQEDFYANTGPQVGQYSTGTEYVATPGRLPMGAISKAATILNNRQVEHDKKRQAFMEELYKPIKTATPYQQNFNQIVRKRQDGFIQSVADAYTGGNISKAHRRVMSDPELRAKWRQLNADLEALGANGERIFATAEKYLADSATLDIESTPENRQLAKDIIYGLGGYAAKDGTGGDFDSLIKKINQFDNLLAREKFFAETVVKSVKDFAAQKSLDYTDIRKGGFMFLTETDKKEYDSQIDAYARRMAVYGYGSYDEMKDWLTKMLPKVEIKKTSASAIPRATRGDGPGGGESKTVHSFPYRNINPQEAEFAGTKKALEDAGFYFPEGTTTLDALGINQSTGGKPTVAKILPIGGVSVIPVEFYRDGKGKLYMFAREAKYTGQVARDKKDGGQKPPATTFNTPEKVEEAIAAGELDMEQLPAKVFPLDRYEDVALQSFGIDKKRINEKMNQMNPKAGQFLEQKKAKEAGSAGASKAIEDMSEAEYKKYLESLK